MAVKRFLLNLLGEKRYLSLVAGAFQRLYPTGLLGKEYEDNYFLKKIIRPDDYCLDIGAHLGYFTIELSQLVGSKGHVFAIEPMPPFYDTLRRLLEKRQVRNVTLYQLALGGNGDIVEMGIPEIGGDKKFALARIKDHNEHLQFGRSVKVRNESGDKLFAEMPRLDYIKCDVEGFEYEVFASMVRTLKTHHPMLLCELFDRLLLIRLNSLLEPLGYRPYLLMKGLLVPVSAVGEGQIPADNYYFLPPQREDRYRSLIAPAANPVLP